MCTARKQPNGRTKCWQWTTMTMITFRHKKHLVRVWKNVLFWLHWFYTNRAGNCPDISFKIQVFDCRLSRCLVRNIQSCYNFSWTVKNIQWFHSCETQMLKYNRNLVKNSSLVVKICGFTFTNTSTSPWMVSHWKYTVVSLLHVLIHQP